MLARLYRLFFLLFMAYGRVLFSVAHLFRGVNRVLVAIPVRNPEAARLTILLWCLCGASILLLQGRDEKGSLAFLARVDHA